MEPTHSTPSFRERATDVVRGRFIRDTSGTDVSLDPGPALRKRRRLLIAGALLAAALIAGATFAVRS